MNSTSDPAATGTFSCERADGGDPAAIDNPTDGSCHTLIGGAHNAKNDKNSTASLFEDDNCDPNQFIDAAQPGQFLSFSASIPYSVQFG